MGAAGSSDNSEFSGIKEDFSYQSEETRAERTLPGIISISDEVVGRIVTPSSAPTNNRLNDFIDTYIVQKVKSLKKDRDETQKEIEAEYERQERIKQLNRAFIEGIMWVNNKRKVMECYERYPHHPMMCAEEVKAFTEAVPWSMDGPFGAKA